MSPPFASSEGVSASGDRLQSDGVQDTHLLPHSLSTRIRERMCDFALTHSHFPFAYIAYIPSYSLLIILSEVLLLLCDYCVRIFSRVLWMLTDKIHPLVFRGIAF